MSTTIGKRTLAEAIRDAEEFREMFEGRFERWQIAGSVRRRKFEVADIEHVVIPKFGDIRTTGGLFAETVVGNLLWDGVEALLSRGCVSKHIYGATGNRWGEKYRGVDFRGFNHEIFCADADNWGAILAIRTGPAKFSQHLVTVIQCRGLQQKDGYVVYKTSGERYKVPTEESYFAACGVKYLKPEDRKDEP